ncbi:nuclear autoantigenic sperm protein isoform X3 [Falco biarmicus]|uniref:nuclear autoantigenic sperm protein isoform X3 n=1 Tax=Falco biarmicus TaxID=345155 RepID=UPI0024BC82D2|nr:nuclear autoantigenic sperm protein isoform X3 [Falco biarmicus]
MLATARPGYGSGRLRGAGAGPGSEQALASPSPRPEACAGARTFPRLRGRPFSPRAAPTARPPCPGARPARRAERSAGPAGPGRARTTLPGVPRGGAPPPIRTPFPGASRAPPAPRRPALHFPACRAAPPRPPPRDYASQRAPRGGAPSVPRRAGARHAGSGSPLAACARREAGRGVSSGVYRQPEGQGSALCRRRPSLQQLLCKRRPSPLPPRAESAPASPTRMEEELAAPSTSTDKTDSMDVDGESKKLLGLGQKHLVMGNIPAAVNAFQEAASLLGKKYGETADECAEAFFYYGKSLLELARMENGVLGNALEGVQVEEEEEKAEDESALPTVDETEESEEEDKENDKAEDDKENELTVEDKESEEDEIGNLELAWDMLELAKVIYKRQETKEAQLHAAQAHLKLGEVSIESENYTQAIEEFQACLALQQKYLEAHDRLLAESHYQLALAYHYNSQFDEAVLQFGKSMEVIDKRMAMLTERIKKAESGSPEDEKEIEELKGLLPEIKEKIEDSKESQKSARVAEQALKATLVGTTSGFAQREDGGSVSTIPVRKAADGASQCVTDISHLVRKKRKPEEETQQGENEAKKSKPELAVNGGADAVPSGNEVPEKMEEETEKRPQAESGAAVESTV